VNRIWEDAVGILETASGQWDNSQPDLAILIDERNGLRMIDGSGWQLEALRTEYRAATAFLVKRTPSTVSVQAQSGSDSCRLQRSTTAATLAGLTGGIAHYRVVSEPIRIMAGDRSGSAQYKFIEVEQALSPANERGASRVLSS
jgi:hypothetical protein